MSFPQFFDNLAVQSLHSPFKMHYSQYFNLDVINGLGTRVTLFVSGCEHQCKGCYNQSTWSPRNGSHFNQAIEDKIINDLNDPRIPRRGLSLSGGDPLYPTNLDSILKYSDL